MGKFLFWIQKYLKTSGKSEAVSNQAIRPGLHGKVINVSGFLWLCKDVTVIS